jgi:hypothetical protein
MIAMFDWLPMLDEHQSPILAFMSFVRTSTLPMACATLSASRVVEA